MLSVHNQARQDHSFGAGGACEFPFLVVRSSWELQAGKGGSFSSSRQPLKGHSGSYIWYSMHVQATLRGNNENTRTWKGRSDESIEEKLEGYMYV